MADLSGIKVGPGPVNIEDSSVMLPQSVIDLIGKNQAAGVD